MRIEALWSNPFLHLSRKDDEVSFLSSVPFFELLSQRQKSKVHSLLHRRTFSDREIVFRKGDPGVGMYIIREGSVTIYNELPSLTREKIVSLGTGDFFGEISLLNDSPRSATVVSTGETVLLCLFRQDFLSLMETNPPLSVKLFYRLSQIVAARLRIFNDAEEK